MAKDEQDVFSEIFRRNAWGSAESVSGPGSTMAQTQVLRRALPQVFRSLGVKTLVDAPCGDFNWMRHLDFPFDLYIGVDIVPDLIQRVRAEHGGPRRRFQVGDLTTDILPRADAAMTRDCFVHLPFTQIQAAAENLRLAGFRFLFVTTFPDWKRNEDCRIGDWRPLNMQVPPFNWGAPACLIREAVAGKLGVKALGVWAVEQVAAQS